MTEMTDRKIIPKAIEAFILQWGDLGGSWGVNRSVSQIHALLYLTDDPMTAEDIADQLQMARSNVSNSLKELLSWKLINRVPVRGDRRDHFQAETDVWEIAARIAAGRKEREIDPALKALRDAVDMAESDDAVTSTERKRLKAMLNFTMSADRFFNQMQSVSRPKRELMFRLGSKISAYLPGGN